MQLVDGKQRISTNARPGGYLIPCNMQSRDLFYIITGQAALIDYAQGKTTGWGHICNK